MKDASHREPRSELIEIADSIVEERLELKEFVEDLIERLCVDVKDIDDHILDKFGPIGKKVSGRETSLLFISESLPIANALIRLGADKRRLDSTLGYIEDKLQERHSGPENSYKFHTMAMNVLSVTVLLYLLRACHRHVRNTKKDDAALIAQWANIRARTSTRLAEALESLDSDSDEE
jgi:hypothetical protein